MRNREFRGSKKSWEVLASTYSVCSTQLWVEQCDALIVRLVIKLRSCFPTQLVLDMGSGGVRE